MASVAVLTLGCKLNQAEGEEVARSLAERGYRVSAPSLLARAYVVQTCAVTHAAEAKARRLLRHLSRQPHRPLLVATGCYVQRDPEELEGLADVLIAQGDRARLSRLLAERLAPLPGMAGWWGRTRALVKVQEGCNLGCSYCIVPRVRGRERSRDPEAILQDTQAREREGYKEIVLTGSRIGAYRWNGTSLASLLSRILGETEIERVRLSSLQPQEMTPALLGLLAHPRLCPHIHLPLQSGSPRVLDAMGRAYSPGYFLKTVADLRQRGVAVTTDVMVGFPGEQEGDFQASLEIVRQAGLARVHVFPYSPRPGTRAAAMPPVPQGVKRQRARRMLHLGEEVSRSFQARFLGQTLPVLWEREVGKGLWNGLTGSYLRVFAPGPADLGGRLLPARLVALHPQGLEGELI